MTLAHHPVSKDTLPVQRRNPKGGVLSLVIASAVLVLVTIIMISFMVTRLETINQVGGLGTLVVICSIVALIPLGFVLWAVYAIDRWEPEPPWLLISALVWGGSGAIFFTLELGGLLLAGQLFSFLGYVGIEPPRVAMGWYGWLEAGGDVVLAQTLLPMFPNITPESTYDFLGAVVNAPLTEELTKAVPVLVAFLFLRKHFDGPIDGVVLGALAGAGFAYTENIQYFGNATVADGGLFSVFFIRGIMSPMTHAIFTAVGIGLSLGIAARLVNRWWALALFPAGYGLSVFLHALWNSAGFWLPDGEGAFFAYYMLVQVPICIAAVLLILLLRRFERRITFLRLRDYSSAGWFSPSEVDLLASGDGRSTLGRWASKHGLGKAMKAYIASTTRLALNRQRVITGRNKLRPVADEAALLGDLSALRDHMSFFATGQHMVMQGRPLPAMTGAPSSADRLGGGWNTHPDAARQQFTNQPQGQQSPQQPYGQQLPQQPYAQQPPQQPYGQQPPQQPLGGHQPPQFPQ